MDVLAQHVLGTACAGPFAPDDLYDGIRTAAPYANLDSETFNRVVEFVATGGYALKSYERYARIRKTPDGLWRISNPVVARQYRLNAGTIIEAPMLNVRLTRHRGRGINVRVGPVLGKIEESFLEALSPGDTFLFPARCSILRVFGKTSVLHPARPEPMQRCHTTPAGNFRCRHISPIRFERCQRSRSAGKLCRPRSRIGSNCSGGTRCCPP